MKSHQAFPALPTKKETFAKHAQKANDPKADLGKHVSMANTLKDWFRGFDGDTPNEYYFNGVRACADWTSADCTEESIATVFATRLPDIDPKLRDYLQHMAHQNGYMNVSQTALLHSVMTKAEFAYKPMYDLRQSHYICHADGSITFLESVPVYGYEAPGFQGPDFIKPKNGEPLAVVVCESVVRLQNGVIQHDFVREDVYGLYPSLERTIKATSRDKAKGKTDVVEQIDTQEMLVSDESTYHPCYGKSYAAVCKEIDFTNPKKDRTLQADIVEGKAEVVEQIDTQVMPVSDASTYHPHDDESYAPVLKDIHVTNPEQDSTPQADPSAASHTVERPNHRLRNVLIGAAVGVGVALAATAVVTAIVFSGGIAAVPVAAAAIGALVGLKGTLAAVFGVGAMVAGISTFFGSVGGALGGAVSDLKQAYGSSRAPKPQSSGSGGVKGDERGGLKKKEPSTMAKLRQELHASDVVIPEGITVTPETVVDASSTPRTERTPANEPADPSLEDPSRHQAPSSPSSL